MKRLVFLMLAAAAWCAAAQQPIPYSAFTLPNGLRVVLCEEHSQPLINGCVVVRAGSKNEKPSATGVAHYFEHIMFKGTDRIGTTNWGEESLYLDSISRAYDSLHAAKDAKRRKAVQQEINRLNIAASQYAIPNEVDAILQKMGCTGLNAGTSYDYTVYYNTLPSNQLANWMEVYAERFRNPVFRLFQSELEAVYEEKNMYENQVGCAFSQSFLKEAFGSHPYSRSIIGLSDHLKNPQPREMQEFFNTYYVANNMTLILVGDFRTAEARRLAEDKFSSWRSGRLPRQPAYDLPQFDRQKVVDVRQTPVKMGVMIFPGVTPRDSDYLALNMLASIIGGNSGLLAKAANQGRLLVALHTPLSFAEAGRNIIIYAPNLVGQSHEKAEQVVWDCLDSIKQGNFSDDLIESVKLKAVLDRQRNAESLDGLASLFLSLELEGSDYDQWLADCQRWQGLTREDIIRVANKYFDRNRCTLIRSKMGFPKGDGAVKPDWKRLEAVNKDCQSPFAKAIAASKPDPIKPQVIDFDNDIAVTDATSHCKIYSAPNPRNDLFDLCITYRYGDMDDYDLKRAFAYLEELGADGKDHARSALELDLAGGSFSVSTTSDHTTLCISGPEQNIDTILGIVAARLFRPTHDAKQIERLYRIMSDGEKKSVKNSAENWDEALSEYAVYGKQSSYLRKTPAKEWRNRTPEQLHNEALKIFGRNGYATFSGNTDGGSLAALLLKHGLLREEGVSDLARRDFKMSFPKKSQVLYCTNRKFLQSNISILVPSLLYDTADQAALSLFNEYFGGGMNSIVFQEIREFRSLGYHTSARLRADPFRANPCVLRFFLGTQCDKTIDGLEAMNGLMDSLPIRQDKFEAAKENLITARNSSYIDFRRLPEFVRDQMELGYTRDPRADLTDRIAALSLDDLKAFHQKYVQGRPRLTLISGNIKKFSLNSLKPYGPAKEVKFDQMFKF